MRGETEESREAVFGVQQDVLMTFDHDIEANIRNDFLIEIKSTKAPEIDYVFELITYDQTTLANSIVKVGSSKAFSELSPQMTFEKFEKLLMQMRDLYAKARQDKADIIKKANNIRAMR